MTFFNSDVDMLGLYSGGSGGNSRLGHEQVPSGLGVQGDGVSGWPSSGSDTTSITVGSPIPDVIHGKFSGIIPNF